MKISKHIHSCLLIEDKGKKFLFDPGNYTFEENGLDINSIDTLDYLLITHEHPDHMYIPLIKEIVGKFPNIKIITNASTAEVLNKEGMQATTEGDESVKLEEVVHEKVFSGEPPTNVMITINNKLSHPGDSYHFQTYAPIIALPLQAPWGHITTAVELAKSLKPKIIIPIHDWHWNEKAREVMYKRLEEFFKPLGIRFVGLETNQEVEV